jgi:hypothetical protein
VSFEDPDLYSAGDFKVVCEACLLERHPDASRGMELAQEWGRAHLVGDVWSEEVGG